MFKRIKVRTNILLHFLFVLLTLAMALIGLQYYFGKQMAKEAVYRSFHQTAHKIALTLKDKDTLSKEVLYQIEHHPSVNITAGQTMPLQTVKHFIHTLKRYENMYAIYLGFPNGDLFEVINMNIDTNIHQHYYAPPNARWSVIRIYSNGNERIREFLFLDNTLKVLHTRAERSSYFATSRPWYKEALMGSDAVRSDPYLFTNLEQKGITYSKKIAQTEVVLALDFTLDTIHQMLKTLRFGQTGTVFLYGRDGSIISSSQRLPGKLEHTLRKMLKEKGVDMVRSIKLGGKHYYAMIIPLTDELGKKTYIGISIEQEEMLAPYRKEIYYAIVVALVLLLMFIPVILYLTDRISALIINIEVFAIRTEVLITCITAAKENLVKVYTTIDMPVSPHTRNPYNSDLPIQSTCVVQHHRIYKRGILWPHLSILPRWHLTSLNPSWSKGP